MTGSESGEGTTSTVVLVLYGDKGVSSPVVIGEEEEFRFKEGSTDLFEVRSKCRNADSHEKTFFFSNGTLIFL